MAYSSRLLLVACGLCLATAAAAQRRSVSEVLLVPEAQVELALKEADYLLAGFNLVAPATDGGSTFAAGQLRLGYEHFWNPRWSGGATLRLLGGDNEGYGDIFGLGGNVTPGLLLRHTGKIGSFGFRQRLGLEYAMTFTSGQNLDKDRALTRLRLDVDRLFSLGEKIALRPRLAYEIATYLRLQRDENEIKERVVDFGSLRAEVGLRLSPRFDVTPWVASQTIYINSLPQFDINGKQTGGGRANLVVPVVGLDLRLTLFPAAAASVQQQLPTQH
ncbi:hypothetical protein [Hymenobacter sp.]|uniref:hypothetical protein n=1 Tax=Hymenobacter sp. TaxID=1898978 RepID=UPI00286CC37C|nr:hypothetical protein [Hymenobacter sp.]